MNQIIKRLQPERISDSAGNTFIQNELFTGKELKQGGIQVAADNADIGSVFGMLTVIGISRRTKKSKYFLCRCECGRTVEKRSDHIKKIKSGCGCKLDEVRSKASITHGGKVGGKDTPTYASWKSMKGRCLNKNDPNFHNYGGRGITVCDRWMSFENFKSDMGERPNGTSIDRIDHDGNYEPSNCRWATDKQQNRNKSDNTFIEINGVKRCISEWADEFNISACVVYNRLRYGWDVIRALTEKPRCYSKKLKAVA